MQGKICTLIPAQLVQDTPAHTYRQTCTACQERPHRPTASSINSTTASCGDELKDSPTLIPAAACAGMLCRNQGSALDTSHPHMQNTATTCCTGTKLLAGQQALSAPASHSVLAGSNGLAGSNKQKLPHCRLVQCAQCRTTRTGPHGSDFSTPNPSPARVEHTEPAITSSRTDDSTCLSSNAGITTQPSPITACCMTNTRRFCEDTAHMARS